MKPQVSRKARNIRPCLSVLALASLMAASVWTAPGVVAQARQLAAAQTRAALINKAENRTDKKPGPETSKAPQSAPQRRVINLFTEQERHWVVTGLGNPVAQLLVLRELNRKIPISNKQARMLAITAREEGPQLVALREKRQQQERALEEAIYGETFEPKLVEQLVNESAETQKAVMKKQAEIEFRLARIFAEENRQQGRFYRVLYENILGPRNRQSNLIAMNRAAGQFNAQARLLGELFGTDLEMLVPSFGNPLAVLLVMRQLELAPEQKTEIKTLAQEVRNELQAERELQNKLQREQPLRNEPERAENPLDRLGNLFVNRVVEERANQQARAMKRQAHIETRIRQILDPRQWGDYTMLLRAMVQGNLNRPALPPLQQPNLRNQRQVRPPLNPPDSQQ